MSYSRYLMAINTALRDTVLPEVQSGRGKDAVINSISVLSAIAANLERMAPNLLKAIDTAALPTQLRELVPMSSMSASGADPGIVLPLSTPSDDFALNHDALPLVKSGAEWLATQPWPVDAKLKVSAVALLEWESAMRHDAMKRVQLAERGLVATSPSAMVADINQPALEKYLRKSLGSDQLRVTEFKFLAGGRARQTALFSVAGTNQIPSKLVLQRDHPGSINSLSGVGMQYPLLKHLHAAGMKVARPVIVERSPEPLGAPFMVSEQVQGTSPIPSMDYWSAPPKSDRLAASLAEQFAKMHSISISGLDEVMSRDVDGKRGQTWRSDVNTLEEQWERLAHAPSMAVTAALAWMRAHAVCVDGLETIVHNDALLHNVLVEHDEITAVLDWEMAHIGHPFEDLGYVRPVVELMTDWSRFIDAYVAAGGRRPTQEQIDFFTLRSIMKLLTNVIQARAAFDSGRTDDPTMAEVGAAFLPKLIERLATQLNMILGH